MPQPPRSNSAGDAPVSELGHATTPAGAGALTLRLGVRPGSGASSAHAVLDEVVVLPAALGAGDVASLVAANAW